METKGSLVPQSAETANLAPKTPGEIGENIIRNRETWDIPAILKGISELDRYSVPNKNDPSQRIKIPQAPEVAPYLKKVIGADPAVQKELWQRFWTAQEYNNLTAIKQNLRLATLLGIDELAQPPEAESLPVSEKTGSKTGALSNLASLIRHPYKTLRPTKPTPKQTTPGQPATEIGQTTDDFSQKMREMINQAATALANKKMEEFDAMLETIAQSNEGNAYQISKIAKAIETQASTLKTAEPVPPQEQPIAGNYVWRAKDADLPVKVTGSLGRDPNGREYVAVEGSESGVPLDELVRQEEKPPEVPIQAVPEITVYNDFEDLWPADEIGGSSASARVYHSEKHPDRVMKVFTPDRRPDDFFREMNALKRLRGTSHFVETFGYQLGANDTIVKKFVNGEDLLFVATGASFPTETGIPRPLSPYNEEDQKVAAWLVSSMEALAEAHQRGIMVGDFKFPDYLWDPKEHKTIIIDLANAHDIDPNGKFHPDKDSAGWREFNDIVDLLKIFLAETKLGHDMGFRIDTDGCFWPNGFKIDNLLVNAKASGAADSFIKIINLMQDDLSYQPGKEHSAEEYAQALKDHFQAVGLDITQLPTPPETAGTQPASPSEIPLTPERQALEAPALEQAEGLLRQTDGKFTEADLAKYEEFKESEKGQQ